jgi:hypothetical protein
MDNEYYVVEVKVGSSNQNPLVLLDQARRLVDLQGEFTAKRNQTNDRYLGKERLRMVFSNRASAERYQAAVEEY